MFRPPGEHFEPGGELKSRPDSLDTPYAANLGVDAARKFRYRFQSFTVLCQVSCVVILFDTNTILGDLVTESEIQTVR